MNLIIIDGSALSLNDMTKLKEYNKGQHTVPPVIVVVVSCDGYSERFLLKETTVESFISDIPSKYMIRK